MSYVDNGAQWRFPIALQVFFALSTIGLLSFLPETPRWLLSHDRREEAHEILSRLHAREHPGMVERDLLEIETALIEERLAQAQLGGKGYGVLPRSQSATS